MKYDIKLNLSPKHLDLEHIKSWLFHEYKSNEGFYSSWPIISRAFKNEKLIILDCRNLPIGFLV